MEPSAFHGDGDDFFADADIVRCDGRGIPRALALLAAYVDTQAKRNGASPEPDGGLALAFRGGPAAARMTPELPIGEMLECIQTMKGYSGCCYVLAGVYLGRLVSSTAAQVAGLRLEPVTAHRLVAVALLLGAKFVHRRVNNTFAFQARAEGIPVREINDLEVRFLRAVDYRLYVTADEFRGFCEVLEGGSAASGGSRKRKAAAAAEGAGEEGRRVRAAASAGSLTCVRKCLRCMHVATWFRWV